MLSRKSEKVVLLSEIDFSGPTVEPLRKLWVTGMILGSEVDLEIVSFCLVANMYSMLYQKLNLLSLHRPGKSSSILLLGSLKKSSSKKCNKGQITVASCR